MRTLRLSLEQINPTVGDLAGNVRLIRERLARAERAAADLAVFPELALTGYPPEDLVLKPAFVEDNLRALEGLAAQVGSTAAVVGFVDRDDAGLYNAAAVISRGKVRGIYRKVLLPNYGVFDEMRTFRSGERFPLFELSGVRFGVSICEDAWVADGPVRRLARLGAEVVVNVNASPYHAGKGSQRQELFASRAMQSRIWFCYLQTVGGQDELVFDGESLVFDPTGRLVARGAQFREDELTLDVTLERPARRLAARARVVRLTGPPRRGRPALPEPPPREPTSRAEEIYAALVLGTRDYVRKNGFRSVVIGLSGGIDSSLTATIAADAIGPENVVGIAMPSVYSSSASLEDAKELAANLGIEFQVIPILDVHRAYLEALAESFAGTEPGLAEENVQARIRGNFLMALSNKHGHLVLTTGNKSEMATGYSTLYGDMAGGFAVLKDVPKTLVYELARWRNGRGPAAIPERVLTKAPSAELRPEQRDEDSLPSYAVLDPILEAYVEDQRPIEEIVASGFDRDTVVRVARMVDASEYKRRQAPPGIKITPRAFGKDRRIPITSAYREWTRDPGSSGRHTPPGRRRAGETRPQRRRGT